LSRRRVQDELDLWFLEHCYGQSGIGLAWLPAACNDFLKGRTGEEAPFRGLIKRLFEQLQTVKTHRFDLCGATPPAPVFDGFLNSFHNERKECAIDGRSPGTEPLADTGRFISALAADQIDVGGHVAHHSRVLITGESLQHNSLRLPIFGYHVQFTGDEADSGRFGEAARAGGLRRAWDFSLPQKDSDALFNGYARRSINGHVPAFGEQNTWDAERYQGRLPDDLVFNHDPREPKTLEHLACDDRWPDADGSYQGIDALVTLKGDVDNLGSIFEKGLEQPSFAKMSALSRQLNAFFSVWLPWYCQERYPSTYTVFAGGDDFFLIGPWRSTIRLAREMREAFGRYMAHNPEINFSAGMAMTKPGLPIRQMSDLGERALEQAKDRKDRKGYILKDGVTCFGHTIGWGDFRRLWEIQDELEAHRDQLQLSTGYLYSLQYLADMAERIKTDSANMEDALWNSRFAYRTRRMLERQRGMDETTRRHWQQRLGELIAGGINEFGSAFKIALFIHLYHHRH
jgi:CRISPR-associated protein Csm1